MTALPEAKLAREAELCYALLAMGTDYDCWHEEEEDVSIEAVISVLKANAEMANGIVQIAAGMLPEKSDCACMHAAEYAIITAPEHISGRDQEKTVRALRAVFRRQLGRQYRLHATMEIRAFAERVLFGTTWEDKLIRFERVRGSTSGTAAGNPFLPRTTRGLAP